MKRGIVIESHASRGEKGEGRMRKLTKSFQKRQSIASRVLCFLLVLAMVVTMVPALGSGSSTVQAAEKEKNLKKIADMNARNEEIDKLITELENLDIIGLVQRSLQNCSKT